MKLKGLNNNQLKIVAMLSMLADHIGRLLLPELDFLTAIGRLSFPIFAYMIAEGCFYTKSRSRYLLTVFCLGALCQAVFFVTTESLYNNILITLSLSIATVFCIDRFVKKKSFSTALLMIGEIAAVVFICLFLPAFVKGFKIDYGLIGVILPVLVYFAPGKNIKLASLLMGLVLLSFAMGGNQWFSLLSVPILLFYNGKRGEAKLKYMFYIFYPAHLVLIYLIGLFI